MIQSLELPYFAGFDIQRIIALAINVAIFSAIFSMSIHIAIATVLPGPFGRRPGRIQSAPDEVVLRKAGGFSV
jgi:hypothetical protein